MQQCYLPCTGRACRTKRTIQPGSQSARECWALPLLWGPSVAGGARRTPQDRHARKTVDARYYPDGHVLTAASVAVHPAATGALPCFADRRLVVGGARIMLPAAKATLPGHWFSKWVHLHPAVTAHMHHTMHLVRLAQRSPSAACFVFRLSLSHTAGKGPTPQATHIATAPRSYPI